MLLIKRELDKFTDDDVEEGVVGFFFFGPENKMINLMSTSANILTEEMKEVGKNMARCDKKE